MTTRKVGYQVGVCGDKEEALHGQSGWGPPPGGWEALSISSLFLPP